MYEDLRMTASFYVIWHKTFGFPEILSMEEIFQFCCFDATTLETEITFFKWKGNHRCRKQIDVNEGMQLNMIIEKRTTSSSP